MSRDDDEGKVRQRIAEEYGVQLTKRKLSVGVKKDGAERFHEFDGATPDADFIIEVKTNELKDNDRYDSAIKPALVLDLYMLSRRKAKTKLLVLTDRRLFDRCVQDMDGELYPDTEVVHCSLC